MTVKSSEVYSGLCVWESGFDTLQHEYGLLKLGSLKRERNEQYSNNIVLHTDTSQQKAVYGIKLQERSREER